MFKRAFFATATLILFSLLLLYETHIKMRPQDIAAFEKLTQESSELRARRALEHEPAHQKRQGVKKDIWTQEETRHLQIESAFSDLKLSEKKDKIVLLETLKKIRCTQDNITFTADLGTYSYPSQQFTAENNCSLFYGNNQIDGTRIQFDLPNETVTYDQPKGRIDLIQFTATQLLWDKSTNKVHLTDQVKIEQENDFTLLANKGTLHLNAYKPTLLVLEEKVRLISNHIKGKESFAVADTLTYNPIDKTILLNAEKKVLFWQEGVNLSASEVLIREDQTVEGHGDVHFAFDLEEQNLIDEFFKQYL